MLFALPVVAAEPADDARIFPATVTEPGWAQLALEGVAMAVPEYFRGVAPHEGSHALAVLLVGGEVTSMNLLPQTIDGHVVFGQTQWRGNFTRDQDAFVNLAPKITDLTLLAAYTAAFETGFYPESKHLQLLLLVVATSAWVDFSKDLFSTNPDNDVVRTWNAYGITSESQRLPYRLLWGAAVAGGAVELGRGFVRLFGKSGKRQRPRVDLDIGPAYVGASGTF